MYADETTILHAGMDFQAQITRDLNKKSDWSSGKVQFYEDAHGRNIENYSHYGHLDVYVDKLQNLEKHQFRNEKMIEIRGLMYRVCSLYIMRHLYNQCAERIML